MADVTRTEAPEDDPEGATLDVLTEGKPHLFIVVTNAPGNTFDLRLAVGGGLDEASTVRLLAKTLAGLGGIPDDLRPLFGLEHR
jgi:hypothetical protein